MLTGDGWGAARSVSEVLGIPNESVHAALLPEDKLKLLLQLRAPGRVVAMVGDGVNDAPALAAADLGIALGTGTDVAQQAAAVTLVTGRLDGVASAILLSRATTRIVRQNLAWAFGYNLLLIPAAAGLLRPLGFDVTPSWAAAAMALSSLTVIGNALRLRG
jgi:Cu+-exporting ATPase